MSDDVLFQGLNLREIQTVYREGTRQPVDNDRCQTEHYRITEWVQPVKPAPLLDCLTLQQFFIIGPGHTGKCFLATTDHCGFEFIRALDRAYMAGFEDGVSQSSKDIDGNCG